MANRFYFVPKIGDGLTPLSAFRPKYTDSGDLGAGWNLAGRWNAIDYGMENCFLIAADVTPEEHTSLNAQTDVLAVPSPIDSNVSAAALSVVQSRLESMNIPGNWVTTAHTYRQVLRTARRVIEFMRHFRRLNNAERLFNGHALATRWNQLTEEMRQKLRTVADELGLDYSGVTNTMTLRQILKLIADQLPDSTLGGEML